MGKALWSRIRLDPVLAACFAALFAFPLGAALAAAGQPRDPDSEPAADATGGTAAPLRAVPAFSVGSPLERRLRAASLPDDAGATRAAVSAALRDLLGASRGAAVTTLVTDDVRPAAQHGRPYRAPRLDALLDAPLRRPLDERRARQANDAAALLVLAAAGDHGAELPAAAPVAFALLDRARGGRRCVPQLNLAFLASADVASPEDVIEREFARAMHLCPGDPTAAWMLGQHRSRRASVHEPGRARAAMATFRRLQRSPGGAALGWSGEADTELRLGYEREQLLQPFSARAHFRRALKLYRRAQRLDRDRGLAAGAARALAGLGRYAAAAAEQRRALAGRASFAPLAARHVEYLERAHRFDAAARAARPLVTRPEFASGRALVAGEGYGDDGHEDAGTPLSIGVDWLRPVTLNIDPAPQGGGGIVAVADLSFIPEFRPADGVTGHDRWCPAWSLPRDLLLAEDAEAAVAALPGQEVAAIAGSGCAQDLGALAELAGLEAGHRQRAVVRRRDGGPGRGLAQLFEQQQNMWRFAGRLDRARAGARSWMTRTPDDPRAADRLGEIEFLAGDHAAAARWFGRSLRLIRAQVRGWSEQEATALVKRGTALGRAGRREEAVATLERADEVASRAQAAMAASGSGEEDAQNAAVFASYHARVQAGDVLLRERRYAAAAEAYEAAREREPRLREADEEVLARPEALHNNQAIAEAKLGHHDAAVAAARKALAADPRSPIFLETAAYALRTAGRSAQAAGAYRAAVAAEPSGYGAWNDLGVVLAGRGRLDEAVDAFRRSLGARDDYAPAWFNLGVAQARRGIAHVLASQGAFGRAFGLDDRLRDRKREFVTEDAVFFADLDLSKPLPPTWGYAAGQERAPVAAAGIVLLVLLGLRLGRTLLAGSFGGNVAGRLIEPVTSLLGRFPRVPLFTPWLVAVLATVAVFAAGLLRGGAGAIDEALVLVSGVLVLTAIVARGRALAAQRATVALGQRGWTPGIALGATVAAFGSAWAPLPVAEPERPAPAVHWIGPLLTGVAALGLLVLAAWLSSPGTIALASAALVMTASLLTPAKPLDGGYVATGTAGIGIVLALLAGALFFVLGVG